MKWIFLFFSFFASVAGFSQEKIEADRPGRSQSAQTVDHSKWQAEAGFEEERSNGIDHYRAHPELLLRYGLFNKLELRLHVTESSYEAPSQSKFRHGVEPLELGAKFQMYESHDQKFKAGVLAHLGLGVLSSDQQDPGQNFYKARLLLETELSKKITVEFNAGRDWDAQEHEQNWVGTFTPSFEFDDHWKAFAELFSYLRSGSHPHHQINAGLAFVPGKKFQIDVSGGKKIDVHGPDYFFEAGLAFQLN